jgi:ubiquitin-protein ligase
MSNLQSVNSPPPPPRTVSGTVVHGNGDNNEATFINLIRRNDILMELKNLSNLKCKNIYIYQSNDIYKWIGVIFIREGFYKGGVFKFYVRFSESRQANPVIQFTTYIYHPLVNSYGYFNPIYNKSINIKHSVSKLLYVLNDALSNEKTFLEFQNDKISNQHAWESYQNHPEFFQKLVKDCVDNSISDEVLYENQSDNEPRKFPKNDYFKFEKIDDEQFKKNKKQILEVYQDMSILDEKMSIDDIVYRFKCAIDGRK